MSKKRKQWKEPEHWTQEEHYSVYVRLPSSFVRGEPLVVLRKSDYEAMNKRCKQIDGKD